MKIDEPIESNIWVNNRRETKLEVYILTLVMGKLEIL